jgi:Nickel responsive protein SCO4226-like
MPLFLVHRSFAEQLDLSRDEIRALEGANLEAGIRWIESFLSADRLQAYCLYEAPSADVIRAASTAAAMPVDSIIEVSGMLGAVTVPQA